MSPRLLLLVPLLCWAQEPARVLTVCEALENPVAHHRQMVVVVGVFKSGVPGMPERLGQDCPRQLVTGQKAWPMAIALSKTLPLPLELRAEVERKRSVVLASGAPGTQPRPERVVAFHGRLVFEAGGLQSVDCRMDKRCSGNVDLSEMPPPAALTDSAR